MNTLSCLPPGDRSVRTQITLTESLKRCIEKQIEGSGVSLSEYLRRAAVLQLTLEEEKKTDLALLADQVIGSLNLKNHPEWKDEEAVYRWSRRIREEWE